MDRRQFVKYTAVLSAGTLIIPGELAVAASHPSNAVVAIPTAAEHVRHGLFSLKPVEHPALPSWLQLFEKHVFYKNGISRDEADLNSLSFSASDIHFTVAQKGRKLFVLANGQNHEIDLDQRQNVPLVELEELKAQVEFLPSGERLPRLGKHTLYFLLDGSLSHGKETISEPAVICPCPGNGHTLHARTSTAVIALTALHHHSSSAA